MFDWIKKKLASRSGGDTQAKRASSPQGTTISLPLRDDPAEFMASGAKAMARADLESAVKHFEQAVALKPNSADFRVALAFALLKNKGNARPHLDRAILLDPRNANAFYLLGKIAFDEGNLLLAIDHFAEAHEANPGLSLIYNDFASALASTGQMNEARDMALAGAALLPQVSMEQPVSRSADASAGYSSLPPAERLLINAADFFPMNTSYLFTLSFCSQDYLREYLAEAKRYGARAAHQAQPYRHVALATADLPRLEGDAAPKRLRVGWVSGDFKTHAVGFFLEGLLTNLDQSRVELFAYSTQTKEDALTLRVRPLFSNWTSLHGLSDQAAAAAIHQDGIDVLMDVSGHTAFNRLPVFAWKPAPVQVSWLGFLGSTGVPGMDFVLSDATAAPEELAYQFTEEIWHLPETFNCYTPPPESENLAVAAAPAQRNGFVTFGSFARMNKLSDATLSMWGRIFLRLPHAKLFLRNNFAGDERLRERLLQRLEAAGVARSSVVIKPGVEDREAHLAAHADFDIILDTFPYPGVTTTLDRATPAASSLCSSRSHNLSSPAKLFRRNNFACGRRKKTRPHIDSVVSLSLFIRAKLPNVTKPLRCAGAAATPRLSLSGGGV